MDSKDIVDKRVFVEHSDKSNKIHELLELIKKSHFDTVLRDKCEDLGKACKIVIKTNLAAASQFNYPYFTDPDLVDALVDYVHKKGYSNVKVVESETKAVLGDPRLKPELIAQKVGFRHPVFNLSSDERASVKCKDNKEIDLAKTMLDANLVINFAKAKNHDWMRMTGALKNMYGTIPHLDKHSLFHKKKSGLNIEEATACVNKITPSDFVFVDWIDSVDGNEKSYYSKPIEHTDFKPVFPLRLIAGKNPIAIDKYLSAKMGYEEDDIPILQEELRQKEDFVLKDDDVVGDDLSPLQFWKKVSDLTRVKVKIQDSLPVPDKLTGYFIRKYHFDVV